MQQLKSQGRLPDSVMHNIPFFEDVQTLEQSWMSLSSALFILESSCMKLNWIKPWLCVYFMFLCYFGYFFGYVFFIFFCIILNFCHHALLWSAYCFTLISVDHLHLLSVSWNTCYLCPHHVRLHIFTQISNFSPFWWWVKMLSFLF